MKSTTRQHVYRSVWLLLLLSFTLVSAQEWEVVGPRGMRAVDIEVHPVYRTNVWLSTGYNLYFSEDNGATWATRSVIPFEFHDKITLHPTNLDTVMVVCDGLPYRSVNRGLTWELVPGYPTGGSSAYALQRHPLTDLPVILQGDYYAMDSWGGAFVTQYDDGASKYLLHPSDPDLVVVSSAPDYYYGPSRLTLSTGEIEPLYDMDNLGEIEHFPELILLNTGDPDWLIGVAHSFWYTIDGYMETRDGGVTWTLGTTHPALNCATELVDENVVWALTEDAFMRTTDGSQTWDVEMDSDDLPFPFRSFSGIKYSFSHVYPETFWYLNGGRLFLTHNSGDSWVEIDTFYDYSNVNDVAASRGDPNRLYLVSDGLWRSDDDGVSWQMVNEISYVEIETGLQPDDVFSGNYRSLDGGVTWDVLDYTNTGIAVGEYGYYVTEVAYDPANTDRVFILASAARFEEPDNPQPYYTTDFGDTWQQPSGMPQYTWEGDYYFDPLRPERVYFRRRDQGGSLYRSDDGGANFALLQDEAYQLEFAPNSDRLIAWSSDGLFSSIDGGETLDLFGELAGEEPLNVEITGAEQVVVLTATSVWFCDPNLDNSLWTRLLLTDLPHEDGFAVSESGTLFLVSEGLRRNAGLLVSAPETDNTRLPDRFELLPVTPNPFNATARVDIALPVPTTVRLEVLNVLGQSMTVLADRRFAAGHHQFVLDGSNWASGAYLLRASVEGYGDQTRRMILLK